jgi:hypothetical protein
MFFQNFEEHVFCSQNRFCTCATFGRLIFNLASVIKRPNFARVKNLFCEQKTCSSKFWKNMLNNCPVLGANADKFYPNVTTIDTAAAATDRVWPWLFSHLLMNRVKIWSLPRVVHVSSTDRNCMIFLSKFACRTRRDLSNLRLALPH